VTHLEHRRGTQVAFVATPIERKVDSIACDNPHATKFKLHILAAVAEFERDLILQRTNEGRARAMAEGVRFGRAPKPTKHQAREALKRVAADETLREIAENYENDQGHRRIYRGAVARYRFRRRCSNQVGASRHRALAGH
jgi:DNA invertase Pin-like site-specific DNA recombinase